MNTLTPYDFQEEAAKRAVSAVLEGRNFLVVSPTGTGKSVMLAVAYHWLVHRYGLRVRIFTSRNEIKDGIVKCLCRLGIERREAEWVVATPVTFGNRLSKWENGRPGGDPLPEVLLVDEAHHLLARTWSAPIADGSVPIIGFTATPMRGDESETPEWRCFYQQFWEAITITEAIVGRYLVPFYVVKDTLNFLEVGDVKSSKGRKNEQASQDVETQTRVIERSHQIIDLYRHLESVEERRTIMAAPTESAAFAVKEGLRARGIESELLIGKVRGRKKRDAILERFKADPRDRGALRVLLGVDMVLEGIDLPPASRIMNLRKSVALNPFAQFIGRGLRTWRDENDVIRWDWKQDCQVVDLTDNFQRFQPMLLSHLGVRFTEHTHVYAPDLTYQEGRTVLSVEDDHVMYEFHSKKAERLTGRLGYEPVWAEVGRSSQGDNWAVEVHSKGTSQAWVLQNRTWRRKTVRVIPVNFEVRVGGRKERALRIGSQLSQDVGNPPIGSVTTAQLLFWSLLHWQKCTQEGRDWGSAEDTQIKAAKEIISALPSPDYVHTRAESKQ